MRRRFRRPLVLALLAALAAGLRVPAWGEVVTLKNGTVYTGTIDRDNTIVSVFDGLRRVILRESRIVATVPGEGYRSDEKFHVDQPLVVHAGTAPSSVLVTRVTPWDETGQRRLTYISSSVTNPTTLTQGIIEVGPRIVRYRGIDGFWQGQVATDQVPKAVVLGLLEKATDRREQNERLRVARFLIQAQWYPEAKAELDRLARDFPELEGRARDVRRTVEELEARLGLAEAERMLKAQQPEAARALLRTLPADGVPDDVVEGARRLRHDAEDRESADRDLAATLRALVAGLPGATREVWRMPLVEILRALAVAPDVARPRLDAFRAAGESTASDPAARLALAFSGWVLGADAAVADLATAEALWKARRVVLGYLSEGSESTRADFLATLQAFELPATAAGPARPLSGDTATRLARSLPPPLAEDATAAGPGAVRICRVLDDPSPLPTEYAVLLPPEYHPLRSYPAVVALHPGRGRTADERMRGAVSWWSAEAARRGYIVIAPEYNVPGQGLDYRYTPSEHAAVELALRDARKRFAIDSDRVFLGGQLLGADMAWDFGQAHPDLFAGVVVISGRPARYVLSTLNHVARLPLYVVQGDQAPAASEVIFPLVKGLISRPFDVTYVEYLRRGWEDFPEEAPAAFDWMDRRRRDPTPKSFEAVAGRSCDGRFYGLVVREFAPGRETAPERVDPLGRNLRPATLELKTSALANLLNIKTSGVARLDVWVSPKLVDFQRRIEVRVNNRRAYWAVPKPDLAPLLEDLRVRGDRQQTYWLKVAVGG
ncbi:MAG TPA: alpha/beta hydrolase [Isosphaeraceae bacterium]